MRRPFLAIFIIAAFTTSVCAVNAATWYVAPQGNDAASGNEETPFATLERAIDAMRASGQPGEIVLRGGTYRLHKPITLSARDSGATIRAYAHEKPVLTGGRTITGWKPFRDQILMANMPGWTPGDIRPGQLFYKGQRQILARYPNYDPADPLYGGWAYVAAVHSNTEFATAADVFRRRWSDLAQGAIFTIPWRCWASDIIPMADVDRNARTIRTTRVACEANPRLAAGKHYTVIPTPLMTGNRFFVQNLLEELDQPGEWCFDSNDGMIYFWPPASDGKLLDGDVTIPGTDRLLELKGVKDKPIQNIAIRGLTFTQTRSLFPPRYLDFNSPNSRGFTLYLEYSANCVIENNTFDQVGGDAVRLEYDSTRNTIRGNVIRDAGAMGIAFNNTDFGGFEFPQYWDIAVLRPLVADRSWARGNRVTDNIIERCGAIDKMSAGIKIHGLNCADNTIANNLIHHVPLSAIWITMCFGRNVVELNHMHHTCQEMSDVGAFVSNRVFPFPEIPELAGGTIVRYNLIHDVIGCAAYEGANQVGGSKADGRIRAPYYTFAIYFDNSGVDTWVFGNIVADATLAAIAYPVAAPHRNIVENNVLLTKKGCKPLILTPEGRNNQFLRNIVVDIDANSKPEHGWPAGTVTKCDQNVYWRNESGPFVAGESQVAAWRQSGEDQNSLLADPCFVDLAKGVYSLRPESPALKMGFQPIPINRIGPRPIAAQ